MHSVAVTCCRSYISAGYVKWIEAAGGRAVPIRFYDSDRELYRLFKSVNALIFPGGLTWLWLDSPYVIAARKLYNWAVEENEGGDPFPVSEVEFRHKDLLPAMPCMGVFGTALPVQTATMFALDFMP